MLKETRNRGQRIMNNQPKVYRYTIQELEELRLKRDMEEIDRNIKQFEQESNAVATKYTATRKPYKFVTRNVK